uniref:DDB1-and CUL4-associated factor 4 n=1 Tax=Callorhinchus milii TaxID=7868 RepID=V9KQ25_CALMI
MKKNNWSSRSQRTWRDRRRNNRWRSRENYSRTSNERYWENDSGASTGQLTEHSDSSMSTGEPAHSSSVSSDRTQSSVPELPGFYFDPEKNRYFRLLPGHNNCNPLTRESIKQKEMEEKRLQMLEADDKIKRVTRVGLNFTRVLQRRHFGLMNSGSYCRLIHELKINNMRRNKLEIQSSDSSSTSTGNFKTILADTACERIFAVNAEDGGCKYGIMNLNGCRKGIGLLTVDMCDNLYFTHRKGSSICWASVSGPDSHVLLCLTGHAETPGCVSLLPASLFSNSNPGDQPGMLCSFKISTAWTCAWCFNPQADKCFSTGLSHRVLVTDVVTGRKQAFGTTSNVLAQQFARRNPVLYNGCRSGEIFSIDIRQRTRKGESWKATRFFHDSAVTSIQLLQDENYLIAADMIGKIKLWDLRTMRSVRQYEGHHNEHAYLPVHINEKEGILLAVGQDCYTRIWSLHDGCLLRTIPSPHPASNDSIPSVGFSSQLGGRGGVPGLLMAVRQDLYHFSYNSGI